MHLVGSGGVPRCGLHPLIRLPLSKRQTLRVLQIQPRAAIHQRFERTDHRAVGVGEILGEIRRIRRGVDGAEEAEWGATFAVGEVRLPYKEGGCRARKVVTI